MNELEERVNGLCDTVEELKREIERLKNEIVILRKQPRGEQGF